MKAIGGRVDEVSVEELQQMHISIHSSIWFNDIMVRSLGLSERTSQSTKHYRFAIQGMQSIIDNLDNLPYEDEQCIGYSHVDSHFEVSEQNQTCPQTMNITVLDPTTLVSKGHPRTLRMKNGLEKLHQANKCLNSKKKGHQRTTCP